MIFKKFSVCLTGFVLFLLLHVSVHAQDKKSASVSASSDRMPTPKKSFSGIYKKSSEDKKVDPDIRNAWFEEAKKRLETFQVSDTTARAEIKTYQTGLVLYWFDEGSLVTFDEGEWLYVITHSGHLEDNVGSAILAVDHAGNLYSNAAHVCRDVTIPSRKGEEPSRLSEFLEIKVDDFVWEKHGGGES